MIFEELVNDQLLLRPFFRISEVVAYESFYCMGYDQYTVQGNVAVESTFVSFLSHPQTYVHGLSS